MRGGIRASTMVRGSAPLDRVRFVWPVGFDPSAGAGVAAPVGTIGIRGDASRGWLKYATSSTSWRDVAADVLVALALEPHVWELVEMAGFDFKVGNTTDPSVTGKPGAVGARCVTFDGTKAWIKRGTGSADWLAVGVLAGLEGVKTVQTFQFLQRSGIGNAVFVDSASGIIYSYRPYPAEVSAPYFDIRLCDTAQSVALVAAAVINAQPTSVWTAGVPVNGLLTLTAKTVGAANNRIWRDTINNYHSTIVQPGVDPVSTRVSSLSYGFSDLQWLVLGDSLSAEGAATWSHVAAQRLGLDLSSQYHNHAVSGAGVVQQAGQSTLGSEVSWANGAVSPPTPNLVTILCGVNDYARSKTLGDPSTVLAMAEASLSDANSFAEGCAYNLYQIRLLAPYARVGVMLPLDSTATGTGTLQMFRDVWSAVRVGMAPRGQQIEIWDPNADLRMLATDATLFYDGTHLTALGQARLGDYAVRKIRG